MKIKCPNQLFINGEFVNSSWGKSYDTINPTDESVRALTVFFACAYRDLRLPGIIGDLSRGAVFQRGHQQSSTSRQGIFLSVSLPLSVCLLSPPLLSILLSLWIQLSLFALGGSIFFFLSQNAFEQGEWGKMSARERGQIMHRSVQCPSHLGITGIHVSRTCGHVYFCRLADLMEEHKEELATLESVDSGAVYTLALKTHVGFSIDCFRYFAGWCDKIHVGQTHLFCIYLLSFYRAPLCVSGTDDSNQSCSSKQKLVLHKEGAHWVRLDWSICLLRYLSTFFLFLFFFPPNIQCLRDNCPVELSADDVGMETEPLPCSWQHSHPQTSPGNVQHVHVGHC